MTDGRRAGLAVLLSGLAAACTQGSPPASDAAAPAVAMHVDYGVAGGALGTQVGERWPGLGLVTRGEAGWLLFGPYASLPPGRYQARIRGTVLPEHRGHVHVDVATRAGAQLLAARELDAAQVRDGASGQYLFVLDFALDQAVDDLEVRVQVDAQGRLAVAGVQVDALP